MPVRRHPGAEAVGDALALGLRETTTTIEATHRAIARRAFGVGAADVRARRVHDAIAAGAYAAVRGSVQLAAKGGGMAAGIVVARRDARPQLARSEAGAGPAALPGGRRRPGHTVLGALNGAFGDALAGHGNALAVEMAVRLDGADVPLTAAALRAAFPDATERVAVFVHGLCESDEAWRATAPHGFGRRLREGLGVTPVLLRYNSGLPIAENGRALAELVERLLDAWPVAVRDVSLVGHSMGGLVVRAAVRAGRERGHRWPQRTSHAVYLGAPHGGAPLEKGAALLARTLARTAETRPLAAALNARSAGIRDLGNASAQSLDPGIRHHAVAATLGPTRSVRSVVLGDLLVRRASAVGEGGRDREPLAFAAADVFDLPGANHFDLLTHPEVYEQLARWLGEPPRRREVGAGRGYRARLRRRVGDRGRPRT